MAPGKSQKCISVVGTGDFACALTKRALENGQKVCMGSRSPGLRDLTKRDEIFSKAKITNIKECLEASILIVVAIPYRGYEMLKAYEALMEGKILVDVSNPNKRSAGASNAERLAALFPKSVVVKAFNTVSAYSLGSDTSNEHREVFVASDNSKAAEQVSQLARDMGFGVHYAGRLQKARDLEAAPLYLFKGWGWPTAFTAVLLAIELLYLAVVMYVVRDKYDLSQIPTYVMYKAFGAVSVNLLAFCYLPGILAAFAQIFYGTKHKRFQAWLDKWLLGRKQLGIYALLFAFMHMIALMSCMNGAYFDYLFKKQYVYVHANATADQKIPVDTKMNLHGEGCIISGLIAICAMGILGLTSLPPVGAMLNWREWRFIQSQFGFVCFVLTVAHCMVHGIPRWMLQFRELEVRNSFMSLVIPWFTLLLKIIYFIPCVNKYVWKVRDGYERGVQYDTECGKVNDGCSLTDSYTNVSLDFTNSDSGLDSKVDKSSVNSLKKESSASEASSTLEKTATATTKEQGAPDDSSRL